MGVRAMSPQYEADDLLAFKDSVVAMQVVLSGCFDKQLSVLRALRDELTERQGALDTVEKTNQWRAEIEHAVASLHQEATEFLQNAKEKHAEAVAKLEGANTREAQTYAAMAQREVEFNKTMTLRETAMQQYSAALSERETKFKKEHELKTAEWIKRSAILKAGQDSLAIDTANFLDAQAKFQSKVDAIMGKS